MSVNPITQNISNLLNPVPVSMNTEKVVKSDGSFADILTESFKAVGQTDKIDKSNSLGVLMGESDDLSGLLIDMQKAELSLQLALQIRNKVLDAYNEVMRMSV